MAPSNSASRLWLRRFSKLTAFSTLFLIFAGGMVTSTGSGLAVPDWPLSYGMLFPPMVGGVFYEHGHRMVAAMVGFFMLVLCVLIHCVESRQWIKNLAKAALLAVILQGLLGGITVKFFLPPPVSILHGILAQTFFILTIILAYSLSLERSRRQESESIINTGLLKLILGLTIMVYIQLILGALMRHTHSGLAIPDFPTMGGSIIPRFNADMLKFINDWRFKENLDPVTMSQVVLHFIHRVWAVLILGVAVEIVYRIKKQSQVFRAVKISVFWFCMLLSVQILLGICTVLSVRAPVITSLHVFIGAATLGMSVLLVLRAAPISIRSWKALWQ